MNFLSLTFRDLQYLVALEENRHFGKAAKACFVSQPALSSQIKKIEGYFGKTFFERKNKQVFLTQDGELVVQKAREILKNATEIDHIFKNSSKDFGFQFTVGLILTLAPYYPNLFIEKLFQNFPNASLVLREGFTSELLNDLKNNKIDVLLASEIFQDDKLDCFPIFKEPLYLIVNKKHPLSKKEKIYLEDLDTSDMIFLKEGNCLRNESIDLCPKNKRGNIKEYYINNLEALKTMAALHPAYAIIPEMAVKIDPQIAQFLTIKKIEDSGAYRQISLYSRKNSSKSKAIQNFVKLLKGLA